MSTTSLAPQCLSQDRGDLQDLHLFMYTRASLGKIYSFLTGRSRSLRDLTTEVSKRKICNQHDAGAQTVPINHIKGSEGRSSDFDRDFNPMHTRTRDRWIRVAVAHACGETLPLVELIRLGDDYFVRDGHHRISVARAFGEQYIDAKVIVLELEPASIPPTMFIETAPHRARLRKLGFPFVH